MSMMMIMNIIASITFTMMKHPLSMGMMLMIQTIMISLLTGNFNYNYWYSYILFLILIGGMLILFMYMTSIASNEKFHMSMKYIIAFVIFIPLTLTAKLKENTEMKIINNETTIYSTDSIKNMMMSKYINHPSSMILMLMIIYLLVTLIMSVKITKFNKGPIRQMN